MKQLHFLPLVAAIATVQTLGSAAAAQPVFTDASSSAGVQGSNVNQATDGNDANILSNHGSGIAWIDIDNDDWPDLYIVNKAGANRLYRNNRDGTFDLINLDHAGAPVPGDDSALAGSVSRGVSVGDYDNDGWDDLFVGNEGNNSLLKNNGDGTFTAVPSAASGIFDDPISDDTASSFGDVDGDGDLDLFVSHWIEAVPTNFLTGESDFFLNQQDDPDRTSQFLFMNNGLEQADVGNHVSLFSDYDSDGDLDMLVPTDFGDHLNVVLNNNAGMFTVDPSATAQLGSVNDAMGISAGDYDRDGDLDYFVTNNVVNSGNQLFKNNGSGEFSAVAAAAGVTGRENLPDKTTGVSYVFWGTSFLDADNDGDLDLYAANDDRNFTSVDPLDRPITDFNRLYMNTGPDATGEFTFTEVSAAANADIVPGMGTAVADYDRDGRLDIVVHGRLGDVTLLRNITPVENDWLQIRLNGTQSNQRGIGAKVFLTSSGAGGQITQLQEVHSGTSHGSNDQFAVHFGVPAGSTVDELRVEWPMGQVQTFTSVPLNHSIQVTEGFTALGPVIDEDITGPWAGPTGTHVGIQGENLCFADCGQTIASYPDIHVRFNGVEMTEGWVFPTVILAKVPDGATSGPIEIENAAGRVTSVRDFTVYQPPVIDNWAPGSGPVGTNVGIQGSNFCFENCGQPISAYDDISVTFNGVEMTEGWVFPTAILAKVPAGATTGPITITNVAGAATTTSNFVVTAPPVISSWGPASGPVGTGVGIQGENFCFENCGQHISAYNDISVTFNGVAMTHGWVFPTAILAEVPAGATTGPIVIDNQGGTVSTQADFVVTGP